MNQALRRLNEEYTMLHYPLYVLEGDSFLEAQENLTNYCMSLLPPVRDKVLLEVGCGNGVQALYISMKYAPELIQAIDLNHGNIEIARNEAERKGVKGILFNVDDAQALSTVETDSVDFVINIESAFHYPDKSTFFRQVYRVLKPGGSFVIADILTRGRRRNRVKEYWKKKMSYYHWPMSHYETELPLANFQDVRISDITSQVIRSFRSYRKWLSEMKKKHFLEDLIMKLYYTIHVRLNIYLLRTSRQYCVFVGNKPF
jgi:ubiquinone/menaquinone biosynthesis C-methylase UbiE